MCNIFVTENGLCRPATFFFGGVCLSQLMLLKKWQESNNHGPYTTLRQRSFIWISEFFICELFWCPDSFNISLCIKHPSSTRPLRLHAATQLSTQWGWGEGGWGATVLHNSAACSSKIICRFIFLPPTFNRSETPSGWVELTAVLSECLHSFPASLTHKRMALIHYNCLLSLFSSSLIQLWCPLPCFCSSSPVL